MSGQARDGIMALVLGMVTNRIPIRTILFTRQDTVEHTGARTAIFKTTEDGVAAAALAAASAVEDGSTAWAISFTEEAVASTAVEGAMGADNYFDKQ
jgi:hypothetical protein